MKRRVEDVMTRTVVVVRDDAPFKEMVRLMAEHRVSALPILDRDERLVGIVSEADLILKEEHELEESHRRLPFERKRERLERAKAEGMVAAEVMTAPVVTIGPGATIAEAAREMHERQVKRLPVVGKDCRVLGIVSRADLMKIFLRPDAGILDEVDTLIEETPWLDSTEVRAGVRGGIVTLSGRVERRSMRAVRKADPRGEEVARSPRPGP